MGYKDKAKQRGAVRLATRRYRAKLKGITIKVSPEQSITAEVEQPDVIPELPTIEPHSCRGCKLMKYEAGQGLRCPRGKQPTSSIITFEQHINPDCDCNH